MVYIVQGLNLAARLPSPPPQFNPRNKSNQTDKTMKYLLTTTTLFAALSLSSCESGPNADRGTLIGDEKNFVRIERASLNRGEEDVPYINFEIRVDGQLERIGNTGDFKIDGENPVWFRLERKGDKMLGSMSQDGKNWVSGEPKELRAEAWQKPNVAGGVAAISTSVKSFAPVYADLSVVQSAEPEKSGDPEKQEK
jgi:hypothetical protein